MYTFQYRGNSCYVGKRLYSSKIKYFEILRNMWHRESRTPCEDHVRFGISDSKKRNMHILRDGRRIDAIRHPGRQRRAGGAGRAGHGVSTRTENAPEFGDCRGPGHGLWVVAHYLNVDLPPAL